jgi:hypothetical protein
MKKLNLQLGSIKEMLTKEQMKKVAGGGGYGGGGGTGGGATYTCTFYASNPPGPGCSPGQIMTTTENATNLDQAEDQANLTCSMMDCCASIDCVPF